MKLKKLLKVSFFLVLLSLNASAQHDTLHIYGPGGPYPVIQELGRLFALQNNVEIQITKGPSNSWIEEAKLKGDLIFSGSEFMMTNFINELKGNVENNDVMPLYYRKSGLLVRPGNPKKIYSLQDLARTNIKILVINGSGLTGLWEDVIGQSRDIKLMRQVRKNIVFYAKNSAEAKQYWISNKDIDVWISWNIWQISNSQLADFIELEDKYTIYRDFGIVPTKKGKQKEISKLFIEFLLSEEAKPIFKKYGWKVD
jgi:accessory colonization factor AcfC